MTNKDFLTKKPRSFVKAGENIGISAQTMSSLIWRKRNNLGFVPKNIFTYRCAINLSNEIINFMLDDQNFDPKNFLKVKKDEKKDKI